MDDLFSKFKRGELLRLKMSAYGAKGLSEIEILEYLLTLDSPSKDCSLLANRMMNRYLTLAEILDSDEIELNEAFGLSESKSLMLATIPLIYQVYQKAKAKNTPTESYAELYKLVVDRLVAYSKSSLTILCFDADFRYIGSIDKYSPTLPVTVWAKEIVKLGAEYIAIGSRIGSEIPSVEDVAYITDNIIDSLDILDIEIIDSIVINNGKAFSVVDKARKLMDKRLPITAVENELAMHIYPLKDDKPTPANKNEYFDFDDE